MAVEGQLYWEKLESGPRFEPKASRIWISNANHFAAMLDISLYRKQIVCDGVCWIQLTQEVAGSCEYSKAGRALDRIGPARFSPARIKRTSAHCFGTYRHQKLVTVEKTHKSLRLEAGIGPQHCSDLWNVLLCPVFRNCSDTCRRGLCRAGPGRCSARPSIYFHWVYLCGLCRSEPWRSDPVCAQLNVSFSSLWLYSPWKDLGRFTHGRFL
jgi:hypothetical protein